MTLIVIGILFIGQIILFANATMLNEIHFTQTMGILCCGAMFMLNLEHLQYTE